MDSMIRVAIITISDTASKDVTADKSGPSIRSILETQGGFEIRPEIIVIPDEESDIQKHVKSLVNEKYSWIITTGGTGFGVRDRTPEAISPLIEREAPGLVHLMMSTSLQHTPLAALSRPVAGTIQGSLIVTLPGSVKAVRENMGALLGAGVISHAIDLIKGGTGKRVHKTLASATLHASSSTQASQIHSHHHHHHSHTHQIPKPRTNLSKDPSLSVSQRHRVSPYELVSFQNAMSSILKEVKPLTIVTKPVTAALKGFILAEDVFAPQNVPSTQTTSVDGYALRSSDSPGVYKVLTSQSHTLSEVVPAGSIYRINTGGPLPAGTDTVIMVEDTQLVSTFTDTDGEECEEKEVKTLAQLPVGENLREAGSDVKIGDLVLHRGEIITSVGGEIGTLAFVGRKEVEVFRKPIVALMSTGNELVDLQSPKPLLSGGWGGIFDTNRPSLQAALEGLGYEVIDLGIVPDDITSHVKTIQIGLDKADILLTTGGTSMGPTDLLKPVIERHFNGTVHFGRIAIKPGKPTTFATVPTSVEKKPVFALPGNPASALVTFHVFVLPALRKLGGWPFNQCQLPRVQVRLNSTTKLDPRTEFHRAVIRANVDGLFATSTGGQRSSRVASLSGANGLVIIPPREEGGPDFLEAGASAEAIIVGEIQMV